MNSRNIKLVRHGEPQTVGVLLGHTDIALSKAGQEQLNQSCQKLTFDRLITSPLKRCSEFAIKLGEVKHLSVEIEPAIMEMDFGQWDGKTYESLWLEIPSIGDFWQSPHLITPPSGESLVEFQTRVNDWWEKLLKQNTQNAVVITHGGVIKQIINNILNFENDMSKVANINVAYAGIVNINVSYDEAGIAWPVITF